MAFLPSILVAEDFSVGHNAADGPIMKDDGAAFCG